MMRSIPPYHYSLALGGRKCSAQAAPAARRGIDCAHAASGHRLVRIVGEALHVADKPTDWKHGSRKFMDGWRKELGGKGVRHPEQLHSRAELDFRVQG
jgi:hypothetical protein